MGFLEFTLIEPFRDNHAFSWFMGIVMWLVVLMVLALIGYGIFYMADTPPSYEQGVMKVELVDFVPVHTTTTYVMTGKVMVPYTTYHDNAWTIRGRIEGTEHYGQLKSSKEIKLGDRVYCQWGICRFSKEVRVKP